ncbi:MAG: hypothetical protein ACLGHX_00485 [Acidimicrobiia bacterium]
MTSSILTTLALLVASLATSLVLTGPQPFWQDGAGAMMAVGHLILTAIAIVGALVGAARWSVGLGVGLTVVSGVVAVAHPVTPAWVIMLAAAAAAASGLVGTRLQAVVRHRPPADAPPPRATALAIGLLTAPVVLGAVQPDGVDLLDWVMGGAAIVISLVYTRAGVPAVWSTRIGLPLLTVASGLAVDFPGMVIAMVMFGTLSVLAWTEDARLAAIPHAAPGRSVPIPAELAPGEILDAAGLDDRGRRKEQS